MRRSLQIDFHFLRSQSVRQKVMLNTSPFSHPTPGLGYARRKKRKMLSYKRSCVDGACTQQRLSCGHGPTRWTCSPRMTAKTFRQQTNSRGNTQNAAPPPPFPRSQTVSQSTGATRASGEVKKLGGPLSVDHCKACHWSLQTVCHREAGTAWHAERPGGGRRRMAACRGAWGEC